MNGIAIVALVIMSGGLLLFFISLPLIYRKVPMNQFYGIRIPASFKSEESWYDINAYGGRKLAACSWVITGAGIVGFFVPLKYLAYYGFGSAAIGLFALTISIIQIYRWACRHDA